MRTVAAIIVSVLLGGSFAQVYVTPGLGHFATGSAFTAPAAQQLISPHQSLAHEAVVLNAQMESQLPDELKNNFYKNPHIAAGLAKESWFGNKEMPVFERAAEKIPRSQIYKIVKSAGFIQRRR